jgi:hypothetical protein
VSRGEQRVREHIATVARRDPKEYAILADALQTVTWPDGGMDRRHGDATAWLQRYMDRRDRGPQPITRKCACAFGRCLVCN